MTRPLMCAPSSVASLRRGAPPKQATERLIKFYRPARGLTDPVDFWLGLALAQHASVATGEELLGLGPPVPGNDPLRPLGVWVYGTKDPATRLTMHPERVPLREPVKQRWWSRPRLAPEHDGILRPLVAWRSLPKWFTEDGLLLDPRAR